MTLSVMLMSCNPAIFARSGTQPVMGLIIMTVMMMIICLCIKVSILIFVVMVTTFGLCTPGSPRVPVYARDNILVISKLNIYSIQTGSLSSLNFSVEDISYQLIKDLLTFVS